MSRKERRIRRAKTLQQIVFAQKKKHDKDMTGKKVILVPHPTIPRTFIEKIVNDDE